jgi:hypothetical protein
MAAEERPARIGTAARTAAGVTALLAVAVSAWSGGVREGVTRSGATTVGSVAFDVAVAVMAVLGVATIVVVAILRPRRDPRTAGRQRVPFGSRLARVMTLVLLLGALSAPLLAAGSHLHRSDVAPLGGAGVGGAPAPRVGGGERAGQPSPRPRSESGSAVLVAALVASLGALAVGLLVARRRAGDGDAAPEADVGTDDSAALESGATAAYAVLTAHGSSPRHAVIAAYAAMEASLRQREGSHPGDTPARLLRRALRERLIEEETGWLLVRLFERARFSVHEIDADDQRAAESALQSILRSLRGVGVRATS